MTTEQSGLSSFTGQADSTTEQTSQRKEAKSSTTSRGSKQSRPGERSAKLDPLYERVRPLLSETYPELVELGLVKPLDKEVPYATNRLPEGIDVLPLTVGSWTLLHRDDETVLYGTDGRAYDERFGKGGALQSMKVYLNNRGCNSDGQYNQTSSTVVGYTNGQQIRDTTLEGPKAMWGIRGHNPQKNSGDYARYGGVDNKSDSLKEAVSKLVADLYMTPAPIGKYVPQNPESGWELKKLSPTTANWTRSAPPNTEKSNLKFRICPSHATLVASNDGDGGAEEHRGRPPIFDVPVSTGGGDETRSIPLGNIAEGIALARELFQRAPETVVAESNLPTC